MDSGDLFFDRYRKALPLDSVAAQSGKAHLILKCYNLLGYDALWIGDDDLTLGKDFLVTLSKSAAFPFVSSNLMDKETGKALFQTHVIREIGGLKVAIFSLLSPHFFSGESDSRTRGIVLREPIEEAKHLVGRIRSETDLVILLSHLGYMADIELAEAVPGIDLILGGHSGHSLSYPVRIKDTIIIQVGAKGLRVGEVDLQLAPSRPSIYDFTLKNSIPLTPSFKDHDEIAEVVREYKREHSPEWFKANDICLEQ